MLDVPRGYQPQPFLIANLLDNMSKCGLYQASLNTTSLKGTITLGISHFTPRMWNAFRWNRGDAIIAHQLVALDLNLLDLFLVDEEAVGERDMLLRRPELLARMPHHAMQSLVYGLPRMEGYIIYLSESRFSNGRESVCTMWGLLHSTDLDAPNLGDPLMHPYYFHMEMFHEELLSTISNGRFRKLSNDV